MALIEKTDNYPAIGAVIYAIETDKGNVVVALDKQDYMNKMEQLFSDQDTYQILKRNPVNKTLTELKSLLRVWKQNGFVPDGTYYNLNSSIATLPRVYGLPKIHKPGHPLRVIVSSIGSPLHNLASYLHSIIKKSLSSVDSGVKNSFTLIKNIEGMRVPDEASLVSLDVVSLFTNIPVDLVLDGISKRWHLIECNTEIPKVEFFKALTLVLNSSFFTFNDKFYRQIFGVPMGSPLSPISADIVMQDLEIDSGVKNSFTLIKNIEGMRVPDEASLVSLDVVSLFTNIPVDLVLDGISKRWHLIECNTEIPKVEFF
ncbi:PREDICTED: uncharacterized protein LOC108761070 [Trachymyrmex cornetzi]|uniref:uncharacterized protein LOC108761070 n=1 Tax=Trachymyrmex cornetzi TaxID=471704 RepID=UPI00084F0222|nr:PREDICTED: uncharacterized protein LOC108761070 [Trachymyrmex cornetzi]